MVKTVVFDYDGTLHDAAGIYYKAFLKVQARFVKEGHIEYKEYDYDTVSKWLGLTPKDMWKQFAPDISDELKREGSAMLGRKIVEMADEAKLYEGSIRMLSSLKGKANLIFLSNCSRGFMQRHIERFRLDNYFDAFYCAEDYGFKPKYRIFDHIKEQFEGEYMVVGDRCKDIEIKDHHEVQTIGCRYGYGSNELEKADFKVESVEELHNLILLIMENQDSIPLCDKVT